MDKKRSLYLVDYCLTPYKNISSAGILCENDKILAIGGKTAFDVEDEMKVMDLKGCYAVPGFIDTHIHGAGGFDSTTAYDSRTNLNMMRKVLARHGVTSFVPTIVSEPIDKMLSAVSSLVQMMDEEYEGAEPVGIHLEGPFLNQEKHGSQQSKHIISIDLGLAKEFIAEGKQKIKLVTFAPELDKSVKLIELLLENNIIPSMGHSIAGEEQVLTAVDAGARRCTHLFNGMPPLHQRNMTLTAVALTDDRITIEMILEGTVLHPRMVELACRSKPHDKVVGVSDAIQGAGMRDGKYYLGESEINVRDGLSTTKDGTIAGTTLTLEIGWDHLVTYTHLNRTEAAACFSINPANNINLFDRGEICPGKIADISFLRSDNNRPQMTVKKGKIIFDANEN